MPLSEHRLKNRLGTFSELMRLINFPFSPHLSVPPSVTVSLVCKMYTLQPPLVLFFFNHSVLPLPTRDEMRASDSCWSVNLACPRVSCLLCRVAKGTGSWHAWQIHVFDVVVSLTVERKTSWVEATFSPHTVPLCLQDSKAEASNKSDQNWQCTIPLFCVATIIWRAAFSLGTLTVEWLKRAAEENAPFTYKNRWGNNNLF